MKLIYECGKAGRSCFELAQSGIPRHKLNCKQRQTAAQLPEVSEIELVRHYTELAQQVYGVDNGFYPLGSCTMKYNPRLNEQTAALEGFANLHPTQKGREVAGIKALMDDMKVKLCAITGMDDFTLQPAAGAHGEFTGILLIKKYFRSLGDEKRTKIIVPDSAHGTNPASANMCGFEVVSVGSNSDGEVDIEQLKQLVGDDTAGLMLTNPNTLGLSDRNIKQITRIVHAAGGLCYYDGANLNAIMGMCRPGDMGFDCMHLNVHKTFSAPHGGGGPGSGPVGCKSFLQRFLPKDNPEDKAASSIGKVRAFYGNLPVIVKGYTYIVTLGAEGLKDASQKAVLNANYLKALLASDYALAVNRTCMHEFVLDCSNYKQEGSSALDIAKTMIDYGMHPPTMYFPLIVHEALMFEPTETESKETLDEVADVMKQIAQRARNKEDLHQSPVKAAIKRVDEVAAARNPILKYQK